MATARPKPTITQIAEALPQLQCRKCGYVDCSAYAHALIEDAALLNRCTPGGEWTIMELAALLNRPEQALDTSRPGHRPGRVVIAEADCIGCARCLPACPVQAIVGMARQLHVVLAEDCTGCELCISTCPVDCIGWLPSDAPSRPWPGWDRRQADLAADHYAQRTRRRSAGSGETDRTQRRREIREAVERVRRRRSSAEGRR
ncbi:MAG: RnfABCDGE type electron transport complex subunit B [Acidiferrobacteraceae bacterium]